jgi:hypothetical protein
VSKGLVSDSPLAEPTLVSAGGEKGWVPEGDLNSD